jgi:hypothetical protein
MKPTDRKKARAPGHHCVVIERGGVKTIVCCVPKTDAGSAPLATERPEPTLRLPRQRFRLEEANLPSALAASLAGKRVSVQILPEEEAGTRRVDPRPESSMWRDPEGNYWNDYQPLRVLFTGPDGKRWRLPRRWVDPEDKASVPDVPDRVTRAATWREELNLPSRWDLEEINIEFMEAVKAAGRVTVVEVHVAPRRPVKVLWRDSSGAIWRIPHDWRKRRIKLPGYDVLVGQAVPAEVAKAYAGKIVSVNYHPGSLCCLPDGYRFRDDAGGKWPVKMRDCLLLGYGDKEKHRA